MLSDPATGPRYPELTPILDTVLDAVVVISRDGVVVAWNNVAETTFGWSANEAVGQPLADLIVPPEHREAHNAGIARLIAGGDPRVLNRRIEISALTAGRGEIPIELSIPWLRPGTARCSSASCATSAPRRRRPRRCGARRAKRN